MKNAKIKLTPQVIAESSQSPRRGCEAPPAMAAPVRTNQGNQVIRHPRTTFGAVIVNVNKRSVSADVRAFTSNYLLGVDQVTKQNKMLHRLDL